MNKELIRTELLKIERKYNVEILYCTVSGSKLYGTDTPNSDLDLKFVFKPKKEDVLLKKDVDHIKIGAQTNEKNTKDDVDFDGMSIYKFLSLLEKSETGAIDVFYSLYRKDTIVFENTKFTRTLKENKSKLLNKNMKSFIGYALGQSKKFGIKGARYDELDKFVKFLSDSLPNVKSNTLDSRFHLFKQFLEDNNLKYIKFVQAPGPRGSGDYKDIEYISVLGKLFEGRVTLEYFYDRVSKLHNQFGNRTKTIANTVTKTDFKALSHALRISFEVKELLETGHIKFPLTYANDIKMVKNGELPADDAINTVEDILSRVDLLLQTSQLPETSDVMYIDNLILEMLDE